MTNSRDEDVSIKDIVLFFKDVRSIAWKNKIRLVGLTVFLSAIVIGCNFFVPENYEANSKLYLQQKSYGANSFLSGMIGEFATGNMLNNISGDAFVNIALTKEVIKNTLLKSARFRGAEDVLGNHLIKYLSWDVIKGSDINFSFGSEHPENFSYLEDSMFNQIFYFLSEKVAVNSSKNGIVDVSVVLSCDTLAKLINEEWINEMIVFFKNKTISSINKDILIQEKAIDSLHNIITYDEIKLTQLSDEHNAIVKAKAYLEQIRLKRHIEINTVMLGEMVKNHEMSKYNYMTQKPIVEIIELPRLPLKSTNMSKLSLSLISIFFTSIISLFVYVFLPYLKEKINLKENE